MAAIGETLSHYKIVEKLGAGGMGEVYQATDLKLGRDVALKVLPEEFARDADRVSRFQREAKVLASLNHPNIAAIHGLEESGGTNFLVLELVPGETLADQLKRGPIPVEESLKLALQIAEALEAAHEKGIIHRDLKPANIKVTPDGKVKVLDFGLAKAFAGDQSELNSSNSPTLSVAATLQGVILGTAAYMSPEQAKGKIVDKRADIWAFGGVLYEMLTGRAAFQGEDVSEILASVIKGDVNLDLLPPTLHPEVRKLLSRCLQRDLKKRYRDIGDTMFELEQVAAHPAIAEPDAEAGRPSKLRLGLPWVAVAIILSVVIAGVAGWNLKPPEPRPVTRLYYELPKEQQFDNLVERALAVSPDGRQFVYCASGGLYLRSMDELDAKLIPGTQGIPQRPFFSPDGKWVGYFSGADNQLKKIAVSGGAPVSLTDASSAGSFGWGADDRIVFGTNGGGIKRVSANGGSTESIVKEQSGFLVHPQILPDGKSVLFTLGPAPLKVFVQSLQSGERKELFNGDTARYLPTGHIVYALGNNLLAVPFDLKTLTVAGGPVPLIEGVLRGGAAPQYVVSDSGTLVYMPGTRITPASAERTLVWVDRNGKEEPIAAPPANSRGPRLSPDGSKVALTVSTAGDEDIWVWDLARKTMTRLTFNPTLDAFPLWTPDGKRIAFRSNREGSEGLYWKAADGTGKDELLRSAAGQPLYPASWSGDGKTFVVQTRAVGGGSFAIGAMLIEGDRNWRPLLQEKYNQAQPRVSFDGQWMAYTSNESGQNQVYVRPFPGVDKGRWQVSTAGGDSPLWSPDGHEMFYRSGDAVMAVSVKTDPAFSLETPKTLFRGPYVSARLGATGIELNPWDISPDGKRFLMMKEAGPAASAGEGPRRINIVLNWFEELKQRVPSGNK